LDGSFTSNDDNACHGNIKQTNIQKYRADRYLLRQMFNCRGLALTAKTLVNKGTLQKEKVGIARDGYPPSTVTRMNTLRVITAHEDYTNAI
jgi:hypothetical protein